MNSVALDSGRSLIGAATFCNIFLLFTLRLFLLLARLLKRSVLEDAAANGSSVGSASTELLRTEKEIDIFVVVVPEGLHTAASVWIVAPSSDNGKRRSETCWIAQGAVYDTEASGGNAQDAAFDDEVVAP